MSYEKFPNQTGQNFPVSTQYQTHPGTAVNAFTSPQYSGFPEAINILFSASTSGMGNAVHVPGIGDFIQVPDSASISQTTTFTIEGFWSGQNLVVQQVLFAKHRYNVAANYALTIGFGTANRLTCFIDNGNPGTANSCTTAAASFPNDGARHHVALVYNGAGAANSDKLKIFIDGVDQSGTSTYGGTIPSSLNNTAEPLEFGRWRDATPLGSVPQWSGEFGPVRYHSTNLSGAAITALAAGGAPPTANLVSNWSLEGSDPNDPVFVDVLGTNNGVMTSTSGNSLPTRIPRTWQGASAAGGAKILCVGDSITLGSEWRQIGETTGAGGYRVQLHNHLKALGRAFDFVGAITDASPTYLNDRDHAGVAGEQIPAIQTRWVTAIGTYSPVVSIFQGGTNDAVAGQTGAQIATRIDTAVRAAYTALAHKIIVVTMLGSTNAGRQTVSNDCNALLPGIVSTLQGEGKTVYLVTTAGFIDATMDFYNTDHLARQGYQKLAARIRATLITLV